MSSCTNGAAPLELPWTNVTVSADGIAISRGIEISVGTPPQVISLRPALADDNLFIFNVADCVSSSNTTCVGSKGGVFDSKKSSTYALSTEASWNGSHTADIQGGSYIFFNDDMAYGSSGVADGYPLFMDQPGQGSQGGLPLGPNSTFLDQVVASGQAPSRTFGIWTGSRSINNPVDGLLVIGGYDTARVAGSLTTFPTFSNCPACVEVTNMTYIWDGGSSSLFSNSSEVLQIGLDPFARGLALPQDMFNNFAKASQGTWDNSLGLYWPANAAPTGNISVTLSNGYITVIPASELYTMPRLYDSTGAYSITNNTVAITTVNNATDPGYVASWGIPYLTMNYLIMDYDKAQFQMSPAHRQDFSLSGGGALVSTICGSTPTAIPTKSVGATMAPTTAVPSATSSAPAASSSSHSNVGPIVGGVVGGVAGLLLIFGALLFFLLRGRKNARNQQQHPVAHGPGGYGAPSSAEGMSQAADPRTSMWTSNAPTVLSHSELASPEVQKGPFVSQWLSSQDRIDQMSNANQSHSTPSVNGGGHNQNNIPIEMSAHKYE